ncbi:uncharacterized protein LOC143214409 isoform X1 [Lasioglossum baleicum]|uniref:uncharacterized protein LOC143214409 isoform X1 n=1 Tax=Lasioglossum baleicum TaxID=434251 RepID=UPI003FCE90D6
MDEVIGGYRRRRTIVGGALLAERGLLRGWRDATGEPSPRRVDSARRCDSRKRERERERESAENTGENTKGGNRCAEGTMAVRFNATYRVPVFPVVGDKSNVLFEGSKEGRRRTRKRKKEGRSTWSLPLVQSGSAWLAEVSYLRRYLVAQREVLREPSR